MTKRSCVKINFLCQIEILILNMLKTLAFLIDFCSKFLFFSSSIFLNIKDFEPKLWNSKFLATMFYRLRNVINFVQKQLFDF